MPLLQDKHLTQHCTSLIDFHDVILRVGWSVKLNKPDKRKQKSDANRCFIKSFSHPQQTVFAQHCFHTFHFRMNILVWSFQPNSPKKYRCCQGNAITSPHFAWEWVTVQRWNPACWWWLQTWMAIQVLMLYFHPWSWIFSKQNLIIMKHTKWRDSFSTICLGRGNLRYGCGCWMPFLGFKKPPTCYRLKIPHSPHLQPLPFTLLGITTTF